MNADQCEQQWLHWFDLLDSDEAIRQAALSPSVRLTGLANRLTEEACQHLDQAWQDIFVPGPQQVALLRRLIDQARCYALLRFPTLRDYNRLRGSAPHFEIGPQAISCLTGLAGVGKSSVTAAFQRICSMHPTPRFVAEGQNLVIHPVRRLMIDGQPAVRNILQGMANPIALTGRTMTEMGNLMGHVRDWFLATATCSLVVDEMQFFTQSSSASTKTSHLIMTMASLGPPLVYVANFSLVRKLMLRPHEEKDRLLAKPMLLRPPAVDDPWWNEVTTEYLAVAPDTFQLDANTHAHELHRYTAGLLRGLRRLLLQAYCEARSLGRYVVTMNEVRLAYRSQAYSSHRKDVEELAALAVSNLMEAKRPDLVCPYTSIQMAEHGKQKTAASHTESVKLPLNYHAALVESTLSVADKRLLHALRKVANKPEEERITATVSRLPKRTPISAESLLAGARALREVMATPRQAKPREDQAPSLDTTG